MENGSAPGQVQRFGGAELIKQVLQYAPAAVVPAAVGVLTAAMLTRVMDSASYGLYTLVLNVATLLSAIASQWLQQSINRFIPGQRDYDVLAQLKAAITVSLVLIGGCVIFVALVVPPFWSRLKEQRSLWWVGALLVLVTAILGPLETMYQAELRAARYTIIKLAGVVLRFICSAALITAGLDSPFAFIAVNALAVLVSIPVLWAGSGLPGLLQVVVKPRTLAPVIRQLAAYGFPMMGWFLAGAVLNVGDRYIILWLRGAGEVGIYSANYSLVTGAAGLLSAPVLLAAHPFLMRAWGAGNKAAASRWLTTIVEWFGISGVLATGVAALFSRDLVQLVLGPDFRGGYHVIPVVVAGTMLWQLGLYAHKPLEFVGKTKRMLFLCITTAALNVVLNLALVPVFGYTVAAYTTLIAYAIYAGVAAQDGQKYLSWRIPLWPIVKASVRALVGFGLAALARPPMQAAFGYWVGLLVTVAVAAVTSAAVLLPLIKPMLKRSLSRTG